MERVFELEISAQQDGKLLRDVLRRDLGISAGLLARIKRRENGIMLNGEQVFVTAHVKAGDTLRVLLESDEDSQPRLIPKAGHLDIRFEDDDILIVNKPAGIPVQPAIGDPTGSLGNIVVWHYAERGDNIVYRPVNRLDSGTSGLMVIAKNSHAHALLSAALRRGEFARAYEAVVHGSLPCACGTVDARIARAENSVLKRCVHPDGKPAVTHYKVLGNYGDFSHVRLELEHGRTHQIRVHMAHLGNPLVGDFLYGTESALIGRCALHSAEVRLLHPISGKSLFLECEMPEDMRDLLLEIQR